MATVSYGIMIKNCNRVFDQTMTVYRAAVSYLVDVALRHYDELFLIKGTDNATAQQMRQQYMEHLIHSTAACPAQYCTFDKRFYKFPSYLRRDAINTAVGKVFSYRSLLKNWEESGRKGRKPFLNRTQDVMPCLYRGNTFIQDGTRAAIKIYDGHDWIWLYADLRKTDLDYITRHVSDWKESAPVLTKRYHKYELRFTYTKSGAKFPKYVKDKDVDAVIGVDLGMNTDAVCSVVHKDGTVTGEKFINSPVEKDRMDGLLNTIRKAQQHGNRKNHRLWRFIDNYNTAIAKRTASEIVSFAVEHHAQVIVFEHLNMYGKCHGSKKQRLSLWRKREIQHRTEDLASRYGIRVSYICAVNTSKLAYDGSGKVIRGKEAGFKNQQLCVFQTGKIYNCDLSASKNIGARYFIRVLLKSMSAKTLLSVQANVPELDRRTKCTLATLNSCYAVLHTSKTAA